MDLPDYKPKILDDDAFEVFLQTWIIEFINALRNAWPSDDAVETVLTKYILKALNVSMSPDEITDYFHISYPGICHEAVKQEDQESLSDRFEKVKVTMVKAIF